MALLLLRTNLPKELMLFPDFPFKEDLPSFVGHAEMLEYLKLYAECYSLHKYISLRNIIEKVDLMQNEDQSGTARTSDRNRVTMKWRVQSKDLETGSVTESLYDFVVVCNG